MKFYCLYWIPAAVVYVHVIRMFVVNTCCSGMLMWSGWSAHMTEKETKAAGKIKASTHVHLEQSGRKWWHRNKYFVFSSSTWKPNLGVLNCDFCTLITSQQGTQLDISTICLVKHWFYWIHQYRVSLMVALNRYLWHWKNEAVKLSSGDAGAMCF